MLEDKGSGSNGGEEPPLLVAVAGREFRVPLVTGLSVREILDATEFRVNAACGGVGACGLCLIQISEGTPNPATASERSRLSAEQLAQGMRLACQVRPCGSLRIRLLNPAPSSEWRSLAPDEETPAVAGPFPARREGRGRYGAAVDLGTSRIRLSLWDRDEVRRIASRTGLNPQTRFGADVLTRLETAVASPPLAAMMARSARDAIGAALADIFARDFSSDAGARHALSRVAVVGNTAMLALLAAKNYAALLQPANWEQPIDCRPDDATDWCRAWVGQNECGVDVIPPLGGFVGSDLLAGILATALKEGPAGSLYIDFGTNTELALWDGACLWVTSTPGGPAFEGSGIRCGLPAERGAIARAELVNDTPAFRFHVIGGGDARGICGSGLVDVAAGLLKTGVINRGGRFRRGQDDAGFSLAAPGAPLVVVPEDLDALQRAKASVGAATLSLLKEAGMPLTSLRRVCIGGAFGRFLHVARAQSIGLLPPIPSAQVEINANTALAGCERFLFLDTEAVHRHLVEGVRLINLSTLAEFDDRFIDNLRLEPLQGG